MENSLVVWIIFVNVVFYLKKGEKKEIRILIVDMWWIGCFNFRE